jgi:NADH dehydrogenase/NADH:ubiquinone oxidoreductase subunit G
VFEWSRIEGISVRWSRGFLFIAFVSACTALAPAQKEKREPLTEAQVEQIREAGIYPDDRINLYTKFVNEHAETIKGLTSRAKSNARAQRLDGELQDLTAVMDELGSNLDVYSERKADLRKALKNLNEAAPRWLGILRALAGEPGFDVARKEAIESGEDLADQAKRLLSEQTDYFAQHKDEQGQERAEPK